MFAEREKGGREKERREGERKEEKEKWSTKYDLLTSKGILLILHRTNEYKTDNSSVATINSFVRDYSSQYQVFNCVISLWNKFKQLLIETQVVETNLINVLHLLGVYCIR